MKKISLLLVYLLVSSCSDDNRLDTNSNVQEIGNDVYTLNNEMNIQFLTLEDNINPADWLVENILNVEPESYERVEDINSMLVVLDRKFTESPRMIANRIKQTHDLHEEHNLSFDMIRFMQDFIEMPTEGTMTVFGSYCQQYYNLRSQGHKHNHAIDIMMGKRNSY